MSDPSHARLTRRTVVMQVVQLHHHPSRHAVAHAVQVQDAQGEARSIYVGAGKGRLIFFLSLVNVMKVCASRASKEHPDIYSKRELIQMVVSRGLMVWREAEKLSKDDLCRKLKIPIIKPRRAPAPPSDVLLFEGRPCNVLKSKAFPTAYTKEEIVDLAVDRLGMERPKAVKTGKVELCRLLLAKGRTPARPTVGCIERSNLALMPHQRSLVEFLNTHRGAVAAFSTGSGKTLAAVAASQCYLDAHPDGKVIVVTPSTLQENFRSTMERYGVSRYHSHYKLYTVKRFANVYKDSQCEPNTMLIIDEAHEFRTDIEMAVKRRARRGADVPVAKVAIKCAKTADKVLLLTATPIYNTPYDTVNLVAMVRGEDELTRKQFKALLKNDARFRAYYRGVFQFYSCPRDENYPASTEHVQRITMTAQYYKRYKAIEDTERQFFDLVDPWPFLTGMRQATNALEPCQKCDWALSKIREGHKTVVYSAFITHGIRKLQASLERPYVQIVGEMSEKARTEAVRRYNTDVNILFITKAGGLGLDLKGTRVVIMLESMWNRPNEEQVLGRAVRYGSHSHLPASQRHVDIYYLMLVKPPRSKRLDPTVELESADQILKAITREKEVQNKAFERKLRTL